MAKNKLDPEQKKKALESMMGMGRKINVNPEVPEAPDKTPSQNATDAVDEKEDRDDEAREEASQPSENSQPKKESAVRASRPGAVFSPPKQRMPKSREMMLDLLNMDSYWQIQERGVNVSIDEGILDRVKLLATTVKSNGQEIINSILSSWLWANEAELNKIVKEYQKGRKL